MKKTKTLLLPSIVGLILFLTIRPVFAQAVRREVDFANSLGESSVEVGVETVEGYSQIYYVKDGQKVFITQGTLNSKMPHSEGEYIAYVKTINGAGQIFLYNITANTTVQITNSRTNLKPNVSDDGKVVWERWIDDTWQVALFDGTTTRRLTEGETSMNADIEGDYVVFTRKNEEGVWRAVGYSIPQDNVTIINIGLESKFPTLSDGKVVLDVPGGGSVTEPLSISDVFVLDQAVPIVEDTWKEVTVQDIVNELDKEPIEEEEPGD